MFFGDVLLSRIESRRGLPRRRRYPFVLRQVLIVQLQRCARYGYCLRDGGEQVCDVGARKRYEKIYRRIDGGGRSGFVDNQRRLDEFACHRRSATHHSAPGHRPDRACPARA
jgi:hypothetical protein